MRLIDADRITREYCIATGCSKDSVSECKKRAKNGLQVCSKMELVFLAETVKAVPVVRCYECKYAYSMKIDESQTLYFCEYARRGHAVDTMDFCSNGEQKRIGW